MALSVLAARWRGSPPSVLVAVVLASAFGPVGEETLPKFHEESEVSLVQVPVVVTARDGQPVRGLTPADFELFDDGVGQRIEAIDVVDRTQFRGAEEEPWQLPPSRAPPLPLPVRPDLLGTELHAAGAGSRVAFRRQRNDSG